MQNENDMEVNIMNDMNKIAEKENHEIKLGSVIDFGMNVHGGYFIKYSNGATRTLCKEQLIALLNNAI